MATVWVGLSRQRSYMHLTSTALKGADPAARRASAAVPRSQQCEQNGPARPRCDRPSTSTDRMTVQQQPRHRTRGAAGRQRTQFPERLHNRRSSLTTSNTSGRLIN